MTSATTASASDPAQQIRAAHAPKVPAVVFHGSTSPEPFDTFRVPAYFVASEAEAEAFADEVGAGFVRVIAAKLNLRNPLVLDDFADFAEWDQTDVDAAIALGHDGAFLPGGEPGQADMFIAFRPDQITQIPEAGYVIEYDDEGNVASRICAVRETIDRDSSMNSDMLILNLRLLKAASGGETSECLSLLDLGADIDTKDRDQWTPLMCAASEGCTETCIALMERGADLEAQNKYQRTALNVAASHVRQETCFALLAHGAKPKLDKSEASIEKFPLSRLQYAALLGNTRVLVKTLEADDGPDLASRVEDAAAMAKTASKEDAATLLKAWLASTYAKSLLSGQRCGLDAGQGVVP